MVIITLQGLQTEDNFEAEKIRGAIKRSESLRECFGASDETIVQFMGMNQDSPPEVLVVRVEGVQNEEPMGRAGISLTTIVSEIVPRMHTKFKKICIVFSRDCGMFISDVPK
ncbi:MAG: hypothetical protein ABIH21_02340 [Patescibacteria group bacterium]